MPALLVAVVNVLICQVRKQRTLLVVLQQNATRSLTQFALNVEELQARKKSVSELALKFSKLEESIRASLSKTNKGMADFSSEQELLGSRMDTLEKAVGSVPSINSRGELLLCFLRFWQRSVVAFRIPFLCCCIFSPSCCKFLGFSPSLAFRHHVILAVIVLVHVPQSSVCLSFVWLLYGVIFSFLLNCCMFSTPEAPSAKLSSPSVNAVADCIVPAACADCS